MNDNQEPKKTPMDIVAEQKLEKWLRDVGLDKQKEDKSLDANTDHE